MPKARIHVVIPAGGESRRMGRPKLLLELAGRTVIDWLVSSLVHPSVATISVLIRPDDTGLLREVQKLSATPVVADHSTADMKESVSLLLEHLQSETHVSEDDGWMLIPADYPIVSKPLVSQLIDVWKTNSDSIIVPTYQGRRGHPVIFPWKLISRLASIPADMGLNWFLQQPDVRVKEVTCGEPSIHWDLDTPEDFVRIRKIFEDRLKSDRE